MPPKNSLILGEYSGSNSNYKRILKTFRDTSVFHTFNRRMTTDITAEVDLFLKIYVHNVGTAALTDQVIPSSATAN